VSPAEKGRPGRSTIPARVVVAGSDLLAGALANAFQAYGFSIKHIALRESELEHAIEWNPDLFIIDMRSHGLGSGTALIRSLRQAGLQVCVIDDARDEARLNAWMEVGTSALIDGREPIDEVFRTINRILRQSPLHHTSAGTLPSLALTRGPGKQQQQGSRLPNFADLTQRETSVLAELMEGHCAEEIANAAFVSISTVRSQIKAILQKLGVSSQLAAVALARRADWSPESELKAPRPTSANQRASVV
jgi:two-component system, NarL family, nitrate/nitrite response regulator NarL